MPLGMHGISINTNTGKRKVSAFMFNYLHSCISQEAHYLFTMSQYIT